MRMRFAPVIVLVVVAVVGCVERSDPAHELEQRLLAPCCWRQTLAEHDSPVATALRREVREQLAAGVSPRQVEDAFVARYGPRIQALGRGDDPRWLIGVVVGAAMVAGAVGLVVIGRRRPQRPPPQAAPDLSDDDYATRLDDELAYLD